MRLTKQQEQYYPAIKWLLNDQHRSGRTTLLAYAFVEKAYHNPKLTIYPFNHQPRYENLHNEIMRYIQSIATENYPDVEWLFTKNWFKRKA